ncbi:hypothetical protein ACRE_037760 [Hapsidospora chrysogenum ATCC 11550]|uniref:Uncharacterized protein n=1 Tax=Hapsidospora chrysogenum (strain ATCC 11550 / CBS 779.69 / DSM 880 / IAM 14645 / JCM 23072 / IMI 49137) TaxID=857340 RepID=A0A086T7T4_HAPC1|nr:hypothetical protein ACRE_037760 [Hapsidospora chrysogenum ATCC 11550]
MARDASIDEDPIPGLKVTLKQSSTASPPSVVATVTNTNTERPVSILSYDSPLDRLALQLGLLSITPTGADEPLDLPKIQVRRVWPPRREDLITIPPGESASNDIVLRSDIVPPEEIRGGATVVLNGQWRAVWANNKDEISDASLGDPGSSSDAFQGSFQSNELEISSE